ncbi:PAH2 domain-containing protein, partial [Byssothecium circinans]
EESEEQGPILNDALEYLDKVKARFVSQPNIYSEFIEIMAAFKRGDKTTSEVYAQVSSLFSSAPELMKDFETFMPSNTVTPRSIVTGTNRESDRHDPRHSIAEDEDAKDEESHIEHDIHPVHGKKPAGPNESGERPPVEFDQALSFVHKAKNRFAAQPAIYREFLTALRMYQEGSTTV